MHGFGWRRRRKRHNFHAAWLVNVRYLPTLSCLVVHQRQTAEAWTRCMHACILTYMHALHCINYPLVSQEQDSSAPKCLISQPSFPREPAPLPRYSSIHPPHPSILSCPSIHIQPINHPQTTHSPLPPLYPKIKNASS